MIWLTVLCTGLLCWYLPGRAWLPLFFPGIASKEISPCSFLLELSISGVVTTLIGIVLLDLGWFSTKNLLGALLAFSVLGFFVARKLPRRSYGSTDGTTLLVLLGSLALLGPPMTAHLAGADGTAYLASAIATGRHGSLVLSDHTTLHLDPDSRRMFFPSVAADRGSPPYARLEGGLVLRDLDRDEVLPAFHHGILPWLAVAEATLGKERMAWIIPTFGALATTTVFAIVRVFCSTPWALFAGALLMAQPSFVFYARFPQPEVPASFFVLVAAYALVFAERGSGGASYIVAAALGAASLIRMEFVFLGPLALWWSLLVERTRPLWVALLSSLAFCAAALAHAALFRTHYWGNAELFFREHAPLVPLAFIAGIVVPWATWSGAHASKRILRALASFGVSAALLYGLTDWSPTLRWLLETNGAAVLIGTLAIAIGVVRSTSLPGPGAFQFSLAVAAMLLCIYIFAPSATPVPWWVVRRAVPGLPFLAIACTFLLASVGARSPTFSRLAALSLMLASLLHPAHPLLRKEPFFASTPLHSAVLSYLLPTRCVAFVSPKLATLGPALWFLADRDCAPYYVAPDDCERAALLADQLQPVAPVYLVASAEEMLCTKLAHRLLPVGTYSFPLRDPFTEAQSTKFLSNPGSGIQIYKLALYRCLPVSQ